MIRSSQVANTAASNTANGSNTSTVANSIISQGKIETMANGSTLLHPQKAIAGLATPTALNLTNQQAQLLNQQQVLLVLQQQSVGIFSQQNVLQQQIKLPSALLSQLTRFLNQNRGTKDLANLPSSLLTALATELGQTESKLKSRLIQFSLQQSMMQLSMLDGEPIKELQLTSGRTKLEPEQLASLLQFLIPIPNKDSGSVFIKEQANNSAPETASDGYRFELNFDLDNAGLLLIRVNLREFSLTTECVCNNRALQLKVSQLWPQLEQRLRSLGFMTQNTVEFEPSEQQSDKKPRTTGLINIKV